MNTYIFNSMFAHTDAFGLLIALIMGLGWGSFATMAIYRIPRGMPWVGDQPRCFTCKHELNIILFFHSFLFRMARHMPLLQNKI